MKRTAAIVATVWAASATAGAETPTNDDRIALEDSMGVIDRGDETYVIGGFGVKRVHRMGVVALSAGGSLWIMWQKRSEDDAAPMEQGVMARLGGAAQLSLWQPRTSSIHGDIFLEGGVGYRIGRDGGGDFGEFDVTAGLGAGYDLFGDSSTSFGAYVVMRAVVPELDLGRPGAVFSVGMSWRR